MGVKLIWYFLDHARCFREGCLIVQLQFPVPGVGDSRPATYMSLYLNQNTGSKETGKFRGPMKRCEMNIWTKATKDPKSCLPWLHPKRTSEPDNG